MNVMIIQPWIRQGGAETYSVNLARQLSRLGHRAAIACAFHDLRGMSQGAREVTYFLPHPTLAKLCYLSRVFFLIVGPYILLHTVWRYSSGFDMLNPHNFPAVWVAVIVGKLRRIPVVWTCNEPPESLSLHHGLYVGIVDFLGWLVASSKLDRLLVHRVDGIHVLSQRARRQVQDRYKRDATVIPPPVDESFLEQGDPSRAAEEFGLQDKFVILCVGKLHPQKNQILSIEALAQVLPEIANAFLVLVGDGPMRRRLQRHAKAKHVQDRVAFLRNLSNSELRDLYALCSVNLFPARFQSWGLTPFEALCAERITVVSLDSGAAEVLGPKGIGIVTTPTTEAFADAILDVSQIAGHYKLAAARGRVFVTSKLTLLAFTEALLTLFEEALSQHLSRYPGDSAREGVGP